MRELTRRSALGVGAVAAAGVAALGEGGAKAEQATAHPNAGTPALERAPRSAAAAPIGTYLFAVVNPDGTLARGRFALSSKKLGTGQYEVIFLFNVRSAAYLASIGLSGFVGASAAGEINVVGRVSDVRGVFIETANSSGALTDLGFHLGVLMP